MTYKPKSNDFVLIDWPHRPRRFRDTDNKTELKAQVASGDYFALLATRLDELSQSLKKDNHSDYVLLEHAIDDLLYLHKYYAISKR